MYQYRTEILNSENQFRSNENKGEWTDLNELGKDGWNLIHVFSKNDLIVGIFQLTTENGYRVISGSQVNKALLGNSKVTRQNVLDRVKFAPHNRQPLQKQKNQQNDTYDNDDDNDDDDIASVGMFSNVTGEDDE